MTNTDTADTPVEKTSSTDSIVATVYEALRVKAVSYLFLPGERLNEVEIAKELGVSRTPLREALNRLTTEGFLRSVAGKGFFFRELDPKEIFDLYELRQAVEIAAIRLAVTRATTEQVEALSQFVEKAAAESAGHETADLVRLDEQFHEKLMEMAGNSEMLRVIHNINGRIQFVRWIDIDKGTKRATHKEHKALVQALRQRDEDTCVKLLEKHIARRLDQIIEAIHVRMTQLFIDRAAVARR